MGQTLNVIIIDKEETSRNIIKSYLSSVEDISVIGEFYDFDLGYDFAKDNGRCLVLIDVSQEQDKSLSLIKKLKESNKDAFIIALSAKTSTETIIKVMRAGAKEFLNKPLIQSEFTETLNELKSEFENTEIPDTCKIISTFSNKGGIGKTSIAVNLAVELAQISKEKVALIDLNLQLGDVATFLDMNPPFAMDYIANNIHNLNEDELLKTMSKYKNTSLYVIADPLNIDNSKDITAEQIKNLLAVLKKTFSYIVIDIGTNIDSKTIAALDSSDLILLIAIVNLPPRAMMGIDSCGMLISAVHSEEGKEKLYLLMVDNHIPAGAKLY